MKKSIAISILLATGCGVPPAPEAFDAGNIEVGSGMADASFVVDNDAGELQEDQDGGELMASDAGIEAGDGGIFPLASSCDNIFYGTMEIDNSLDLQGFKDGCFKAIVGGMGFEIASLPAVSLPDLESVTETLAITGMPSAISIDMRRLRDVSELDVSDLGIHNLDGLPRLAEVGTLIITGNLNLPQCLAEAFAAKIQPGITIVENNRMDCDCEEVGGKTLATCGQ